MSSQADLGNYYRDFLRVSKPLLEKKRLAESDRDRLFLDGFPEPIKSRVLRRLEIKLPDQDPDDAYTLKQVYDAAHFLLKSGGSLQAQSTSTKTTSSPSPSSSRSTYVPSPQTTDIRTGPGIVVKQEYTMQQTPRTCYFCGTVGHTSKRCDEVRAYQKVGKVKIVNDRITLGDGAWIPREQGKTMKEIVDSILQERQRNRDIPPHVTTPPVSYGSGDRGRNGTRTLRFPANIHRKRPGHLGP